MACADPQALAMGARAARRARGGHRENAGERRGAAARLRGHGRPGPFRHRRGLHDRLRSDRRVRAAPALGPRVPRDPRHADHGAGQALSRGQRAGTIAGGVPPIWSSSTAIPRRRSGRSPGFATRYEAARPSTSARHERAGAGTEGDCHERSPLRAEPLRFPLGGSLRGGRPARGVRWAGTPRSSRTRSSGAATRMCCSPPRPRRPSASRSARSSPIPSTGTRA